MRKSHNERRSDGLGATKEYAAWGAMKTRCYNKKYKQRKDYGGRGIEVCERWLNSYENFLSDMGRAPTPNHSLDRIDNSLDYEPDNCRWATSAEQNRNSRRCKLEAHDVYEIRGLIKDGLSRANAAEIYGISYATICDIVTGRSWK